MKNKQPLSNSKRYVDFVDQRDKALERILSKYLDQQSGIVKFLRTQIDDLVHSLFHSGMMTAHGLGLEKQIIEQKLSFMMRMAASSSYEQFRHMIVSTYTLAYAGEAEAIARAIGKKKKAMLTQDKIMAAIDRDAPSGGKLKAKIEHYYDKLKHDILEAISLSMVTEEKDIDVVNQRIDRAFPKKRIVKRAPRLLKSLKEADYVSLVDDEDEDLLEGTMTTGFIDDDAWQQVVQDYRQEQLPLEYVKRGPEDIVETTEGERYEWEVEKELMESFVQQVRAGQVDAAEENKIHDFQWIAIVDKSTDECCLWRDGLSTKEIEQKLGGEKSEDECQATVPPAHFNCRCKLAPITDEMPDESPPDFGSFEQWLSE